MQRRAGIWWICIPYEYCAHVDETISPNSLVRSTSVRRINARNEIEISSKDPLYPVCSLSLGRMYSRNKGRILMVLASTASAWSIRPFFSHVPMRLSRDTRQRLAKCRHNIVINVSFLLPNSATPLAIKLMMTDKRAREKSLGWPNVLWNTREWVKSWDRPHQYAEKRMFGIFVTLHG